MIRILLQERIARLILQAKSTSRRPRDRPRTRWTDNIHGLLRWSRLRIQLGSLMTVAFKAIEKVPEDYTTTTFPRTLGMDGYYLPQQVAQQKISVTGD